MRKGRAAKGSQRRHFVIANSSLKDSTHWFLVAWDGNACAAGGTVYIWDSFAEGEAGSNGSDPLRAELEALDLRVVTKWLGHQNDGWRCGYFAMWYQSQAVATDWELGALQMKDMPLSFVRDVQRQITGHHAKLERVVDRQLTAAGKLNKKVVQGEYCWVLRWSCDNQNREKLWWVKGRFLQKSWTEAHVQLMGKDAPISLTTRRPAPSVVPMAHLRHYGDPPTCSHQVLEKDDSSSSDELEVMS